TTRARLPRRRSTAPCSCLRPLFRYGSASPREYCLLDLRISAAATEVARHRVPDLVGGGLGTGLDESRSRDDLARRAEAALKSVRADERVDEWMLGQAFDRRHLAVADCVGERDAGEHRHAVELHRAGAAVPFAAGDLGAGQAEVEPQRIRERPLDG